MPEITEEKALKLGIAQTRFRKAYYRKKAVRNFCAGVLWIAGILALIILVFNLCFAVIYVDADGVGTGTNPAAVLIVNRLGFDAKQPKRGEMAVYKTDLDAQPCAARIIAFSGESVDYEGGQMQINGTPYSEPYITGDASGSLHIIVPAGEYFLMNDNRANTNDSRNKEVQADDLIGNVAGKIDLSGKVAQTLQAEKICSYMVDLSDSFTSVLHL